MSELKQVMAEQENLQYVIFVTNIARLQHATMEKKKSQKEDDVLLCSYLKMLLDVHKKETALLARKIEMVEQRLTETKRAEAQHKQALQKLLFNKDNLNLPIDAMVLAAQVSDDHVFFVHSCDVLFTEFETAMNKDMSKCEEEMEALKMEIQKMQRENKLSMPNSQQRKYSQVSKIEPKKTTRMYDRKSDVRQAVSKMLYANDPIFALLSKIVQQLTSVQTAQECLVQGAIHKIIEQVVLIRKDVNAILEPKELYELAELYLFMHDQCKLYKFCQDKVKEYEQDAHFLKKCDKYGEQLLASVLSAPLSVADFTMHYQPVIQLVHYLCNEKETPSPIRKLALITRICKMVIELMGKLNKITVVGTDDFLPVLICFVAVAKPLQVISQLNFIKTFGNEEVVMCSEHAFYLCSLESAVYYVSNFDEGQQEQQQGTTSIDLD